MQTQAEVFRHSDSLVARDLAGEKVIIPVRGKVGDLGCIYTLNGVAGEIWNLLDGKRTTADIVGVLGAEYDVNPETLVSDVERTLREFHAEGLIVGSTPGGAQG